MSSGHHSNGDVLSDSSSSASSSASASASQSHPRHHNSFDIGGGALDEARLQYKSSVAALRSVLIAIANSQKVYFAVNFSERFGIMLIRFSRKLRFISCTLIRNYGLF